MIGAVLPRLLDEVRLHLGSQDARGSAAFSLFSITLIFMVGRRWMGAGAGLWAAALYGLLPVSVYLGRAVTPDVPMTTFILLAVLATDRWIERRRPAWARDRLRR